MYKAVHRRGHVDVRLCFKTMRILPRTVQGPGFCIFLELAIIVHFWYWTPLSHMLRKNVVEANS